MSENSLNELRNILDRHKENETIYKEKIRQINSTRTKIADQLDALQQTYDKKVKSLEQKLEAIKSQNETLIRQNILYKSEIESYQNRLLEKQKIIAMLLNQKKDFGGVGSSQRSKSDKTDSINANEDDIKNFKKHGTPIFKQQIESTHIVEKNREQISIQDNKQFSQTISPEKCQRPQFIQKIEHIRTHPPPPPPNKKKMTPIIQAKEQKSLLDSKEEELQADINHNAPLKMKQEKKSAPPPPSPKAVNRPPPPMSKKIEPRRYEALPVEQKKTPISKQHINEQDKIQQIGVSWKEAHHKQQQKYEQQQDYVDTQNEFEDKIDVHQPPAQQEIDHFDGQINNIYQIKREQIHHFEPEVHEEQESNFLSHFNKYEAEQEQHLSTIKKTKSSLKKRQAKSEVIEQTQTSNPTDFFSQLGRTQQYPAHNLQIQESSIDHADRDNSLISNEQTYFVENKVIQKPAPSKMAKKKGKRDQIREVDPSMFA